MQHELRFVRLASGTRIAWARSGRPGGPVLVRLAHWMTHVDHDLRSPVWQPWIRCLGRRVELVRYDERGCGLSDSDAQPLGLEAAVEELAAVIEARAAPKVALLGASGAGAPAIAYAARYPERVSHLVLVGAYSHGLLHHKLSAEALAFHETALRLIELGWGRRDPAVQQFFTTRFIPEASRAEAAALNEQQRLSCDGARAAAIARARAALDVRELLPRLRVPTLVLHAEGDLVVPAALGRELAANIPGARFELLRSNNHLPLGSEPAFARFCDAVCDFVHEGADAPTALPRPLTRRERELGACVALGLDNGQIAARLGVAEKTVRNAMSALYLKLGVEGRAQAVARARDMGL